MISLFRSVFLFSVLYFLSGCATVPKPVLYEAMTAEEMRYSLRETTLSPENFSAEGSITVNSPRMNQSAGFEIVSRRIDSVQISVFGPFGITVGSAFFTRNEFTAYNALNNTVYRGSPEKQMNALPFINTLPFELLSGVLQGIHLVRFSSEPDSFTVNAGRTYSFAKTYDDGSYDKFLYDEDLKRISRCIRKNDLGETLWRVEYNYKHIGNGVVIPTMVEVFVPAKETSLTIEYDNVRFNDSGFIFGISFPDDARIITIE